MLHDARFLEGLQDITACDLDVSPGLPGIIQQYAVANDMRFALGEVAPATGSNQGTAITCGWGHQKGENDSNEECDQALD